MGIIDELKEIFNMSESKRRSRLGVRVAKWEGNQPWYYRNPLADWLRKKYLTNSFLIFKMSSEKFLNYKARHSYALRVWRKSKQGRLFLRDKKISRHSRQPIFSCAIKFYSSARGVKSEALSLPNFFRSANSAVAVNSASLDEFNAVSHESCSTPIIKPTPTTCIAISLSMPKLEQATGIRSNEPPATPDAPHAPTVEIIQSNKAVGMSTVIPNV